MDLQKKLGKSLATWSLGSMIAGIILLTFQSPVLSGIGLQALLWGLIDLIIALPALIGKKRLPLEKMRKILLVNAILDVIYMVIGLIVIFFALSGDDSFSFGNGIGVIIQGCFLFLLDTWFYNAFTGLNESINP